MIPFVFLSRQSEFLRKPETLRFLLSPLYKRLPVPLPCVVKYILRLLENKENPPRKKKFFLEVFVTIVHMSGETLIHGYLKTRVARLEEKVVDQVFNDWVSSISHDKHNVVGLDAKWTPAFPGTEGDRPPRKLAILQLCMGSECIILHLLNCFYLPRSLFNFLGLEQVTFIGVGIKAIVSELEKEFGILCNNAVDLQTLAAEVFDNPYLKSCGLSEWADRVLDYDIGEYGSHKDDFVYHCDWRNKIIATQNYLLKDVLSSDWSDRDLSKEQVTSAAISAYDFQMLGTKLHIMGVNKTKM